MHLREVCGPGGDDDHEALPFVEIADRDARLEAPAARSVGEGIFMAGTAAERKWAGPLFTCRHHVGRVGREECQAPFDQVFVGGGASRPREEAELHDRFLLRWVEIISGSSFLLR